MKTIKLCRLLGRIVYRIERQETEARKSDKCYLYGMLRTVLECRRFDDVLWDTDGMMETTVWPVFALTRRACNSKRIIMFGINQRAACHAQTLQMLMVGVGNNSSIVQRQWYGEPLIIWDILGHV